GLTALSAEFTIGEGELMAHDVPLGCAPDEYDDLISGTCSHLPYPVPELPLLAQIRPSSQSDCPRRARSASRNARSPQILMLRFAGMLTLKPKKSPCAKAGASHVRAYFLLVKYHPAVDQQ
ncbi:hypothetical protein, partial [Klebsiella quasipneumoniae]|uniref:hypothetical protein n=1 Tax=Klebsiella quasipneumoniae TaxID=1463165 RepID=UPI001C498108